MSSAAFGTAQGNTDRIAREVGHELVMLPHHGIFDNLNYRVSGAKVTLFGQVVDPALKASAEKAIRKIEGVEAVDNQVEVLPSSAGDDRIRLAVYHALYSRQALERYQLGAVAPIHIIVKNGVVTLIGAVENETDKNLAGAAAKGVLNVTRVNNDLTIVR